MDDRKAQASTAALEYSAGPGNARVRRLIVWLTILPILIATIASIVGSVWSIEYRLAMPWSQNPWESAIVADAWRFAHGQQIYEPVARGHATHLYGPLTSPTIGLIFKIFGTSNLYIGRWIVLISSLAMCAILLWIYAPRNPLAYLIGAGLLLALHYRGRAYFVETRPDMVAALLATISLICFYSAHARQRWLLYLPGTALLIGAMLFKQTYASAAAVPLIAALIGQLMQPGTMFRRELLFAITPLVAVMATILAIKTFTPNVYFYMFTVPTMYEIGWMDRAPFAVASLFTLSPLFVALAGWFVLDERRRELFDAKMRWLLAALGIGCGAGMLAYAKRGGSYNSLLLGFIPMTAFCVALIGTTLRRLTDYSADVIAKLIGGWLIGLLIVISTFGVPNSDLWNFAGAHGGPEYSNVVVAAGDLSGRVVCPDDPTIIMSARNEVCRSLEAELDATNRPGKLPPGLYAEIARADWLIRVHGHYDGWYTPEMMDDLGFERLPPTESGTAFKKLYSLWKRVKPAPAAAIEPVRPKRRTKSTP
ncbi:hypothetical protein BH09PLA1_BH09PLA1_13260 [soil metagenome]